MPLLSTPSLKIHTDFSGFVNVKNPIVTIGTFDGVHLGHMSIIKRLQELSQEKNGESVILTFYPHPRMVLHPDDHDLQLLNTPEEKAKLLEQAGINHLMVYPFSEEFSRITAYDYVRNLLVTGIRADTVVVGHDHRYGRNREGDFNTLLEWSEMLNFNVEEISAKEIDEVNISSTKIRQSLLKGDIETANAFLGYNYQLCGKVVTGARLGNTIGFPTANILVNYPYKLIPAKGVYAVRVKSGEKTFNGVTNIGVRPTVDNNGKISIETHIFDFNNDIYDTTITIEFIARLREEKKFGSIDELKNQIAMDIQKAKELL